MTEQANVLTQIEMLKNTDFEYLHELSDIELEKLFDATKYLTQTVKFEQCFRQKIAEATIDAYKKWILQKRERRIRLELKKVEG